VVTASVLLGVDVGGTSTDAVVVAGEMEVIGRSTLPTGHGSRQSILATVLEASRLAVADASVDGVAAVGIGVPGIVDDAAGSTRHAVNLGIEDDALDIGPALSDRLGVPSHVENDARAAAHGAYMLAAASDPQLRSLAYVSIGTGISAGFVLDGDLYRGSGGIAGEIGHVVADPAGPTCACGLPGCLEAIASGRSASRWGGDGHGMTALFDSAAAGDAAAIEAGRRIAAALARALYGLVLSHDVERIVVGGGVIRHTPPLVTAIEDAVAAIETASPLATDLSPSSRISIADPSLPIGAIGAAALAARVIDGSVPDIDDRARQPL
jgi:predicted NBD/HSP70 family sugar kinase